MNNFKKLLASAMALTMVTSVVPVTGVNAAVASSETSCDIAAAKYVAFERKLEANTALDGENATIYTMNSDMTIDRVNVMDFILANSGEVKTDYDSLSGDEHKIVLIDVDNDTPADTKYSIDGKEGNLAQTKSDLEPVAGNVIIVESTDGSAKSVTVDELLASLSVDGDSVNYKYVASTSLENKSAGFFTDLYDGKDCQSAVGGYYYGEAAEYAVEVANTIRTYFGKDYDGTTDGKLSGWIITNSTTDSMLNSWANELENLVRDYSSNLTEYQAELVDGKLSEIYGRLGKGEGSETYEKELADFVEALTDGEGINGVLSLEDFLDTTGGDKDGTITKAEVNAQIKAIKALNSYKFYKDESVVADLIAEYENMLTTIDEITDALNTKNNEAYAEYIDGGSKSTRAWVKKELAKGEDENLIGTITTENYLKLKAFKEEVVDVVWTMEAKAYANNYTDKSGKNVFATTAQKNVVMTDFGSEFDKGLLTFDRVNGTWYYDDVVEHMEQVIASLDLIENELSKLEAVTLTANDRDLLNSIDDAVFYLKEYSEDNLTSAQTRELRNAERKIDELLEAYRVKFGTVGTTTGWVDMGNGNWKYYEADGTAPTKWICSAPNTWYYVQNGVMLRNAWVWRDANSAYYVGDDGVMVYGPTTVNGYELDANGLWHR